MPRSGLVGYLCRYSAEKSPKVFWPKANGVEKARGSRIVCGCVQAVVRMAKHKKLKKNNEKSVEGVKVRKEIEGNDVETDRKNNRDTDNKGDKNKKGFREPKKPRPVELADEPIVYTKEMFIHRYMTPAYLVTSLLSYSL